MNLGSSLLPHNFAIDRTRQPPQLVTWTRSDFSDLEVIADGIEDLQVAWACDMNLNGIYEEGRTDVERRNPALDEWTNNVSLDIPPTCLLPAGCVGAVCTAVPVGQVRITLIARSLSPMLGDRSGFRPAAEDHAVGSISADLSLANEVGTYSRAVLTSTVAPRNIRRRDIP